MMAVWEPAKAGVGMSTARKNILHFAVSISAISTYARRENVRLTSDKRTILPIMQREDPCLLAVAHPPPLSKRACASQATTSLSHDGPTVAIMTDPYFQRYIQ